MINSKSPVYKFMLLCFSAILLVYMAAENWHSRTEMEKNFLLAVYLLFFVYFIIEFTKTFFSDFYILHQKVFNLVNAVLHILLIVGFIFYVPTQFRTGETFINLLLVLFFSYALVLTYNILIKSFPNLLKFILS